MYRSIPSISRPVGLLIFSTRSVIIVEELLTSIVITLLAENTETNKVLPFEIISVGLARLVAISTSIG